MSRAGTLVRVVGTGLPEVQVAALLDLLAAACTVGASVPRALQTVGAAAGGRRGTTMERVARELMRGCSWDDAWAGAGSDLVPVADALRQAWVDGAAPSSPLATAARRLRRERHTRALEAAGRLSVRLVLPLGLCHLPAFVLLGLIPVLSSLAAGALGI
jgi:hypothetical protein